MDDELREQLETQLHEKMAVENEIYLAEIKTKPIDEIIGSALRAILNNIVARNRATLMQRSGIIRRLYQ